MANALWWDLFAMFVSQLTDADACFVGGRLTLNLAEEGDVHRQLADDFENGEGNAEPYLLVPLDLHNSAMFDDEDISRGEDTVEIRGNCPQEGEESEQRNGNGGIGKGEFHLEQ